MRKLVLCPFINRVYDTDIQLDFNQAYEYALKNKIFEFAILDALSLEYYSSVMIY